MTDSINACPTTEQLKALVDLTLSEDQQIAIQAHVDGCLACQQQLESLVAGSESWDAAVGHLRSPSPRPEEAILSDAILRMKANEFVEGPMSSSLDPTKFLTPSDQPGSIGRLGMYEVTEIIGQGGMGVVVKAFDPALHRVVAVKVLAPYLAHNPQARKRFVREAQAIAAVSHDHVITIHAIDESVEQPKIVMQYVAGQSLQHKIDAEGSLDLKEILRIGMQTASGLAAAHAQGLVHRDVKPSNILLENGVQRVKLTDFGLARAVDDASLTQSGVIAGTPQYMAPEQANGDAVDYRADLFSLGSVLYAMCVGHSPFRASTTMGVLKRVCHDSPRPIQELNPDIPDWLCAITMKLLAKKPEDRFSTAKSVADLLEKWLAHVQQPMIVAEPRPTPTSLQSDNVPATESDDGNSTKSTSMPERASSYDDVFHRTIFFQQVTLRAVLFYFLTGMALTMSVILLDGQPRFTFNDPRVVMPSVFLGLLFCFFAILLTSLGRFFWANVQHPSIKKINTENLGLTNQGTIQSESGQRLLHGRWPPESIAMLIAIAVMLLSGNPLIAAIVAIIVWRLMTLSTKRNVQPGTGESLVQTRVDGILGKTPWSTYIVTWMSSFRQILGNLMRGIHGWIFHVFDLSAKERNRIALTIGWCLVGGADLLAAGFFCMVQNGFLFALLSLAMSWLSFAMSNCIYVRQNFVFVQRMAFIGLLPVSIGAFFRIPLSIVTLFWLESAATSESFESTLWPETKLGRLIFGLGRMIRSPISFFQRLVSTATLLAVWSFVWLVFVTLIVAYVIVPYVPSIYWVSDESRVAMKGTGLHQAELRIVAAGTGRAEGLQLTAENYKYKEMIFSASNKNSPHKLKLQISGLPMDSTQEQNLKAQFEACLSDVDGEQHREHVENLLQVVQRLNFTGGSPIEFGRIPQDSRRRILSFSERMQTFSDAVRQGLQSDQANFTVQAGELGDHRPIIPTDFNSGSAWQKAGNYKQVSSMLDPKLFDINDQSSLTSASCYIPGTLSIPGAIGSFLVWLLVTAWVVRRRHFRRVSMKKSAPAVVAA